MHGGGDDQTVPGVGCFKAPLSFPDYDWTLNDARK